ncbi:hypothetical protein WG902_02385 [Ramlibacter sp. PS3R-8]|uniref:hypothetical protein n=1 Tax=Ramlibacter sp. PS3R-8 TaxID=3133437 RepID=UPI00309DBFE5
MRVRRAVLTLAAAAACGIAGCSDDGGGAGARTAVMGGSDGNGRQERRPVTDGRGREIPPPHLPATTAARVVAAGQENALAVWIQDGRPFGAAYAPGTGWSAPRPLEQIHGHASDPELVANAAGAGMAVWRQTVGSILSLRFSRFDPVAGWSVPDVMPGALPRPPGQASPLRLHMDAAGDVTAQWPSGFDANEMQLSRYTAARGWSPAVSERVATESPAPAGSRRTAAPP